MAVGAAMITNMVSGQHHYTDHRRDLRLSTTLCSKVTWALSAVLLCSSVERKRNDYIYLKQTGHTML